MRTTLFAMLFAAAIGCGGSDTERRLVESDAVPSQSMDAGAETGLDDTPHYQALDKILLRMIGSDYREYNGSKLQRMDATLYFLGVTNIKAPHDDNPNAPEIEWRLVFPTEEPDDGSLAGWSFVKGRWEDAPDDESRYSYVAYEFYIMATDLITIEELRKLTGISVDLAENGNAAPGGEVHRSEPLILESGYRCMVEFLRAPDSPTNSWPDFRQVLVKFAPVDTPRLPHPRGSTP